MTEICSVGDTRQKQAKVMNVDNAIMQFSAYNATAQFALLSVGFTNW